MRQIWLLLLLVPPSGVPAGDLSGTVEALEGAAQKKLRARIKYAGPGISDRKDPDPSPAVVWLEGAPAAEAKPAAAEIRQEGLEFRPRVLAVTAGSTVSFPNGDALTHNVFSYSKAKRFDLGRYGKGQTKEVLFDAKGLVDVRCEVHDHMRASVHVFDHPWFAVADGQGRYRIPAVPPGKYVLVAWKEFFEPVRTEVEVGAGGATLDVKLAREAGAVPAGVVATASACCDAR
jgi:plastocyanin